MGRKKQPGPDRSLIVIGAVAGALLLAFVVWVSG
jgi:hypothetical protein